MADLVTHIAGIESRKDAGVLNQRSTAFKDIHQAMADQVDLSRW